MILLHQDILAPYRPQTGTWDALRLNFEPPNPQGEREDIGVQGVYGEGTILALHYAP